MAVNKIAGAYHYTGLSTDIKPVGTLAPHGSTFLEEDTGAKYTFAGSWIRETVATAEYGAGIPATFTKMTAQERAYNVTKGALNKLKIRPQIVNEHCESSREIQGTVTPTNIVGQIVRVSQDNLNGGYATLESAAGVLVDDFEEYTDDADLQAVWVANSARLAVLNTGISETGNSMEMLGSTNGDEWMLLLPGSVDMTGFTGSFNFRQNKEYNKLKFQVFIEDGSGNTKSSSIAMNLKDQWEHFDINIDAMVDDGAATVITDIVGIGFRTEDQDGNDKVGFVDNIIYTPVPGSVLFRMYDMGVDKPISGVTTVDDGVQVGTAGTVLSLIGGKRLYFLDNLEIGDAPEDPANVLLNVGNYYIVTIEYIDTEVAVYGPDTSFGIDYYESGYAFTIPDTSTAIDEIGEFSNLMFAFFSTGDVWLTQSTARADAQPGIDALFHAFIEDKNMDFTDVIINRGIQPGASGVIDLTHRPPFLPKGGKYELYYNDDLSDSVRTIIFGMQYVYIPPVVNG